MDVVEDTDAAATAIADDKDGLEQLKAAMLDNVVDELPCDNVSKSASFNTGLVCCFSFVRVLERLDMVTVVLLEADSTLEVLPADFFLRKPKSFFGFDPD